MRLVPGRILRCCPVPDSTISLSTEPGPPAEKEVARPMTNLSSCVAPTEWAAFVAIDWADQKHFWSAQSIATKAAHSVGATQEDRFVIGLATSFSAGGPGSVERLIVESGTGQHLRIRPGTRRIPLLETLHKASRAGGDNS